MRTFNRFILIVLLGCLIVCSPSSTAQLETNKGVVRQLVDAINSRNYNLLDEIIAPDFIRHCQATPDVHVKSRDEMKQFLQQDLSVCPDAGISLEMILAEGNMVAGYLTYSGTQKGAMGPYPPTGKKVELGYLSIMRLEGGKIVEMWVEWDNLAMLSQLGHFPPQEKTEE
jgi:predicted ester cyclase